MLLKQLVQRFDGADPYWKTESDYIWVIQELEAGLGDHDIYDLRPGHFKKFLDDQERRVSLERTGSEFAKEISGIQRTVCTFLRWLSFEIAIHQACREYETQLSPEDNFPFSHEEISELMKAAERRKDIEPFPFHDRALLTVLLLTGLSYADTASLQFAHLTEKPLGVVNPRTSRFYDLQVPEFKNINRYWMERGFLKNREPLFVNANDEPLGKNGIWSVLAEIARDAHAHVSSARFLRTFLKQQLEAGNNEQNLLSLLEYSNFNLLIHELLAIQRPFDFNKFSPVDNWRL